MLTVYGIPQCQSVKKARQWLDDQQVVYQFHDYKKQGVPEQALAIWVETLGWEVVLNRRSTTWRQLPATSQQALLNSKDAAEQQAQAIALMLAHPSLIKRPLVTGCTPPLVGFDAQCWSSHLQALFNSHPNL